jgi:L-ectoine synthase
MIIQGGAMIVRDVATTTGTLRHAHGPGWDSKRLIVASDQVGFSMHDTTVPEGSVLEMEYRHHVEANYCFSGEGELFDVAANRTYPITPGTLYMLDKHDRHILRAIRGDLRLVCVFTPPLSGSETHDANGGFEPGDDA